MPGLALNDADEQICPKEAWMVVRESPMNVMLFLEVQWIKGKVGWDE